MIPGPRSRALARRLRRVESRNVTFVSSRFPVFWESARGSHVIDADRRSYLDLTSAFAVASLGHRDAAVAQALTRQARTLWHGMGDVHPSRVKVELLEELSRGFPGGGRAKAILSSSGAEAVESALKTARLYSGKPGVLAFEGSYHGLTYGALSATSGNEFRKPFLDQLARFVRFVPYPDTLRGPTESDCLTHVERTLRSGVIGAVLVEPVQGRGGIRAPKPSFLRELSRLAKRYDACLIVDEIMTGFGRTGAWFALDPSGVAPDLLCVGKALAGGFPLSACIGRARVMDAWPVSDGEAIHTSTFLGSPLGCAMALTSLRELRRRKLAERSKDIGTWWLTELRRALADHPRVGEIRGLGLMIGLELVRDRKTLKPNAPLASQMVVEGLRRGLILLSGGRYRNVLTLTPPLTISKQDLQRASVVLGDMLGNHRGG